MMILWLSSRLERGSWSISYWFYLDHCFVYLLGFCCFVFIIQGTTSAIKELVSILCLVKFQLLSLSFVILSSYSTFMKVEGIERRLCLEGW